ncbi:hypothetical protein AB0H76_35455 [Nocardia sp. NPDC050712]|uniref:hypothetical protein n=1 Tax=Nocardia sp. NPDC050712 TaxID=3155518 RepID=UPI0033D72AFD
MNTPVAAALLVFYSAGLAAPALVYVRTTHSHAWQATATVLVFWGCGVALLVVRRDPLPITATAVLTLAAPALTALVTLTPPLTPFEHSIWPSNVYMVFLTFLCVRGRTWYALLSMTLTVLVLCQWAKLTGQGALTGVALSLTNLGPLAMSTMFAYTIRPNAAKIFAAQLKQEEAARKIADAATNRRALDKRLQDLAQVARPLIERVGEDSEISPEFGRACAALESQISATLRGSGLVNSLVNPSADAARNRGVEVTLFDDGDLEQLDEKVRHRLLRGIADELDRTQRGSRIVIRIVPSGRPQLATVRAQDDQVVRRVSFDESGNPGRSSVRSIA